MDQNDPQTYCTWEWNALISSKRPTIWYKTSADVTLYSSCCQNGHEVDKLFFIIFLTTFINFKICSKNIFFQWFLLSTLESWINVLHSYLFLKLFSLQHILIQDNTLIRFQQNFLATHFKVLLNLFSAWNYMKNITHLGKSEKIKREEGSLGHQMA